MAIKGLLFGMATATFQILPQSDRTFNVAMTTAGGELRTITGFNSEHEAADWIVQIQRLLQQSDPPALTSFTRNLSWHSSPLLGTKGKLSEAAAKAVPMDQCPKGRHVMYAKLLDNLAPDNLPAGEMICDTGDRRTAELRLTTAEQLLHLGTRQVVYLKAGTCDDEMVFVIYSADGTPIVMVEELETAMGMVAEQGLIIIAVH